MIEFPSGPESGNMTLDIPDNWPAAPAGPPNVLVASVESTCKIAWQIPTPHNMALGGSFQLRVFAESIGPGPEQQIGADINVPVVPGQVDYNHDAPIPGSTLLGEGELHGGVPVSGVYKLIVVLQHMNPGPTWISGFAETNIKMFLNP